MEVILLEKIRNLGALGDKVSVKGGFARNYLVPQGKAVYANKDNIAKFEARRAELEKKQAERHARAVERQAALEKLGTVKIVAKAGEEGKLFGSIGVRDIVDAILAAGGEVEKREVTLSEGTLRHTGEYDIHVELEGDVTAIVKLEVTGEG